MEKRFVHKSGNLIWVNLFVNITLDENGAQQEIIGMAEDISERKRAEIALKESNEKFHQLADNLSDAFWIRSPDLSQVQYISPAFEKIWGRSVDSLYTNPHQWSEFIFPEDRERVLASFATLTDNVSSIDIEYRITRPNGDVRWVNARGFQVRNVEDQLIRHIGIVTDITERKQIDERIELQQSELRNSEEKYRTLIETMPDGFYKSTAKGRFLDVNPAMVKMLGYNSKEELLQIDIPAELYFQEKDRDVKNVNQDSTLKQKYIN